MQIEIFERYMKNIYYGIPQALLLHYNNYGVKMSEELHPPYLKWRKQGAKQRILIPRPPRYALEGCVSLNELHSLIVARIREG